MSKIIDGIISWWTEGRVYIQNRFIDKTHLVRVEAVQEGEWRDRDYVLFHAMFQVLVDFVEKELWQWDFYSLKSEMKRDYASVKGRYDNNELSIGERLYFEQNCADEFVKAAMIQDAFAFNIKENNHQGHWSDVKKLYDWYRFERPRRSDPFDFEFDGPRYFDKDGNATNEMLGEELSDNLIASNRLSPEYGLALTAASERQAKYEAEDTENAKKLIDLRELLWT